MMRSAIDHEALRAKFNPDGSLLRRQQMRMLDMLLVFDEICRRDHIRYWLSSGTLLGAVRHKGFIPWDDDLDVEMPREDYLRLMDVLPRELPDWLALQNHRTDPNYFYFYAKLRDRRSYLEETINYDRLLHERGIYIDIFPLEKQWKWIHLLGEKTVGHMYKVWRTSRNDEKSMRTVKRIFNLNRCGIYPILRGVCRLFGAKVYFQGMGIPFHTHRYTDDIFPLRTCEFEGHQFPVPHNADHMLRGIYGDYMQLPDIKSINLHVNKLEIYE